MVAPHGIVRANFPVRVLVTLLSWMSLGAPCIHSAIPRVILACSHGDFLLGASSAEVAVLGLFWQSSLAKGCSGGGYSTRPAPLNFAGLGLLPHSLLIHAQSGRGLVFWLAPSVVDPLYLLLVLQSSLTWGCFPQSSLHCTCSCVVCCLMPVLVEFTVSDLFL